MKILTRAVPLFALLALAGCEGEEPRIGNEPFDTIAPPLNEPVVPGADEPGPSENPVP